MSMQISTMKNLAEDRQIELLKTALEFSYDGIHILDKDGWTLYINQACTRIEGTRPEEVATHNIRQLVEMGVYSESVTLMVLEKKEPVTIRQRAKNGNELLVTGVPVLIDGALECVIVNSRDITELSSLKREVEEKEELAKKYHEELELLRREQVMQKQLVAKSPAIIHVLRLAGMLAGVDSSLLISGESGVGKGVISRYVHDCSERKNGPFMKIDCGTIPENLFESELFGYEKGAFTGASANGKVGLLELANGGTVFLDEIGEMPLAMQPKLLRALQDKEFFRVGGKQLLSLDVRVIAATNKDLSALVSQGQFREDLYYRLAVVPLAIPPLRERSEDILPHIMEAAGRVNGKYGWSKSFSNKALEFLEAYSWPGNVRELENLVERLLVTSGGNIVEEGDLPLSILREGGHPRDNGETSRETYVKALASFDHGLLQKTVRQKGSMAEAARALGMNVTTLRRKFWKYEELLESAKIE